ncbi:MAG: SDR family oxidoreductase [Planctomycetes bacterium]|nr:SDR family oxidoreductase [Planctomycetota bacterium]MCB9902905.1 SDR family oxidoreductase [Planctomycetota bacterium]
MSQLQGKTALITGGNSGIGFASARRFLREGARVIITGRRADAVAEAVRELGDDASGIVADASDLDQIGPLLEQVQRQVGKLDVLFLNAGIAPFASLEEQTPDDYDRVFATNVRGPYFTIQKALPLLNDGASILITGSVVAVKGFAGASVYSASKAAVRNIARTLTSELAPRGIRINILSPGPIETPIYGKLGKSEAEIGEMAAGFASMVPLGRFGGADETAAAALFLVSDQSSFVTGADLHVDGGLAQV